MSGKGRGLIGVACAVLVAGISAGAFGAWCSMFTCCEYLAFRENPAPNEYVCYKTWDQTVPLVHAELGPCSTDGKNCSSSSSRRLYYAGQIIILATCTRDCDAKSCGIGLPQPITGAGGTKKAWDYKKCYNPY
jgi:hypothetical protein